MPDQEVEKRKHNISVREMPMELWREFRALCLRQNVNVEDAVIQAINDYVEKQLTKEVSSNA